MALGFYKATFVDDNTNDGLVYLVSHMGLGEPGECSILLSGKLEILVHLAQIMVRMMRKEGLGLGLGLGLGGLKRRINGRK